MHLIMSTLPKNEPGCSLLNRQRHKFLSQKNLNLGVPAPDFKRSKAVSHVDMIIIVKLNMIQLLPAQFRLSYFQIIIFIIFGSDTIKMQRANIPNVIESKGDRLVLCENRLMFVWCLWG